MPFMLIENLLLFKNPVMFMLDEKTLSIDEYQIQHFDVSSTEFYENLRQQIRTHINETVDKMEITLTETLSSKNVDPKMFETQMNNLRALYWQRAQEPLEKLKLEVRKVFAIPENVFVESDSHNTEPCTDQDLQSLELEVTELEKELLREKFFQCQLKAEQDKYKKLEGLHDKTEIVLKNAQHDKLKTKGRTVTDLLEMKIEYEKRLCNKEFLGKKEYLETFSRSASQPK